MQRRVSFRVMAATVLGVMLTLTVTPAHAMGKINANPTSITIDDGGLEYVAVQLTEPIICQNLNVTCDVTLDFSASATNGIVLQPSVISWAANDWWQMRAFSVILDPSSDVQPGQTVILTATASSASEYYNSYVFDVPVTYIGLGHPSDPSQTAPPADLATTPAPQLATTGPDGSALLGWAALALLGAGFVIRRSRASRR